MLQEQIQYQSEQSGILIFLTVGRHEKQQNHDQQVSGVKIPGQQLPEEGKNVDALGFWWLLLAVWL